VKPISTRFLQSLTNQTGLAEIPGLYFWSSDPFSVGLIFNFSQMKRKLFFLIFHCLLGTMLLIPVYSQNTSSIDLSGNWQGA
jgi:hypothetical protein